MLGMREGAIGVKVQMQATAAAARVTALVFRDTTSTARAGSTTLIGCCAARGLGNAAHDGSSAAVDGWNAARGGMNAADGVGFTGEAGRSTGDDSGFTARAKALI